MTVGILKETGSDNRVPLLPGEVLVLRKMKVRVMAESHAGEKAFAADADYISAGAEIAMRKDVIGESDICLSVNLPVSESPVAFSEGQIICSLLNPAENREWLEEARAKGLTILALDLIPRITRAQAMDVLSSMATVSGYKAVLDAASLLPRFFPMFMSASGTIKPAKVLILGAGVAGLQALAIARKLGAVVEVFDVRSAVRDEVRSLGGKFIEVEGAREDKTAGGYAVEQSDEFRQKQSRLIQQRAISSDVIICTAQIPGKRAPVLVTGESVMLMKPGSVIIDLAASTGGNCELTKYGKNIIINMVNIVGRTDYPSYMPTDSSRMFGNNIINLLKIIIGREGQITLNMDDEIIRGTVAVYKGNYVSARLKQILDIT